MTVRKTGRPALKTGVLKNWLTIIFRVALGMTLLVFGASKLSDLPGFVDTVASSQVLPEILARPYALVLPWVEVVVGVCLILGLGLAIVAPAAILIIVSLIAGTSASLYLMGTGGKPCGCLGGVDWQLGTNHLVAQVVMLVMAIQVWLHKDQPLRLGSRLLWRPKDKLSPENKTE